MAVVTNRPDTMSKNSTICWTDIPVKDLDRAIRFYSAVLAKSVRKESGPGFELGVLPHKEDEVGGCLVQGPEHQPSEKGPLVYLSVEGRLDHAIQAVEKSGGKILQGKHAIGPYGYRALIHDSEGNRMALHSQTA
jgi:uncharacterized protein